MKWNTEPLYDDDGTEYMDRHPIKNTRLEDRRADMAYYATALFVWLVFLAGTHL